MYYAKWNDGNPVLCPRNGYVGNRAISNLNVYFEQNPEVAKAEGYFPFVPLEQFEENVDYIKKDDVIYERREAE